MCREGKKIKLHGNEIPLKKFITRLTKFIKIAVVNESVHGQKLIAC